MKRKPLTKTQCQRQHARDRLHERYGLSINRHEMRKLELQIRGHAARFVCRQSCRITLWVVSYQGVKIPVVYDTNRHTIVTFLPQAGFEAYLT